jgi:NDP-sugar pyrophosphorylase family protein
MPGALPAVCILAGGLGTRLGAKVRDTPKPLLEVAGEPFLDHQLRLLARNGAHEVVVCVGYLGELIEERIGAERFGVAPALGERFLVLYGDTYLRLDYQVAADGWGQSGLPAMMTVLRNQGRWDTSNASFDGRRVSVYDKRNPRAELDWIDYGLGGLEAHTLDRVGPEVSDLADLYHELARRGELFGFEATERFYEIGTPGALAEADAFLAELP